ncbi:hypothetical protein ACWGS9_33525 [Bradyrhizobium sp. Arg314]
MKTSSVHRQTVIHWIAVLGGVYDPLQGLPGFQKWLCAHLDQIETVIEPEELTEHAGEQKVQQINDEVQANFDREAEKHRDMPSRLIYIDMPLGRYPNAIQGNRKISDAETGNAPAGISANSRVPLTGGFAPRSESAKANQASFTISGRRSWAGQRRVAQAALKYTVTAEIMARRVEKRRVRRL